MKKLPSAAQMSKRSLCFYIGTNRFEQDIRQSADTDSNGAQCGSNAIQGPSIAHDQSQRSLILPIYPEVHLTKSREAPPEKQTQTSDQHVRSSHHLLSSSCAFRKFDTYRAQQLPASPVNIVIDRWKHELSIVRQDRSHSAVDTLR